MPWGVIKKTYTIPELKYTDVTAFGAVSGSGSFSLLNGLNLGTSAVTRVGRQIMMKSIHLKFDMNGSLFANTPTSAANMLRIMILYDAQPNGALPAASDLLENTTTGVQTISGTAMRYAQRFRILYDKRWILQHQLSSTTTGTFSSVFDEVYLKVNLKTIYANSNNGDITDIDTGALLLFITSDAAATANYPDLLFYSRVRYVDN